MVKVIVTVFYFQIFEQLCNDLADVHPAVLLSTFVFGTLGILYFFWSITVSGFVNIGQSEVHCPKL